MRASVAVWPLAARLLARIETFTDEGPIEWMPSNRLLGIRHMPLSIRRRSERRAATG